MKELFERHGISRQAVAEALGVRSETVRLWCLTPEERPPGRSTSRPSPANAIALEEKFGIPRWETRPDLWGPPSAPASRTEDPPGGDEPHTLAAA